MNEPKVSISQEVKLKEGKIKYITERNTKIHIKNQFQIEVVWTISLSLHQHDNINEKKAQLCHV